MGKERDILRIGVVVVIVMERLVIGIVIVYVMEMVVVMEMDIVIQKVVVVILMVIGMGRIDMEEVQVGMGRIGV